MPYFEFTITLAAPGTDPIDAWNRAVEAFTQDPGPAPEAEPLEDPTFEEAQQ